MLSSARLLRLALHRHQPHARPLSRFADRLRIRHSVLLPLHIGLDVGRRDQPYHVAQFTDHACPLMSASAYLHRNRAGRLGCKELQQLASRQTPAEHHMTRRIRPMCLQNPSCEIQSYRADLSQERLLK